MKAKLLQDSLIVNPLYNRREARRAANDGKEYPHPQQIEVAAGFVLTDSDCWVHCCPGYMNATPIAEPADDECREAVQTFLKKTRPQLLQRIRDLYENIHSVKDADLRRHIEAQAQAYGITPGSADVHAELAEQFGELANGAAD